MGTVRLVDQSAEEILARMRLGLFQALWKQGLARERPFGVEAHARLFCRCVVESATAEIRDRDAAAAYIEWHSRGRRSA